MRRASKEKKRSQFFPRVLRKGRNKRGNQTHSSSLPSTTDLKSRQISEKSKELINPITSIADDIVLSTTTPSCPFHHHPVERKQSFSTTSSSSNVSSPHPHLSVSTKYEGEEIRNIPSICTTPVAVSRKAEPETSCFSLVEQLETSEKLSVLLSEDADKHVPRHPIGCTKHECHGSMMEKKGFDAVSSELIIPVQQKLNEAVAFLRQFYSEEGVEEGEKDIHERIDEVTDAIMTYGKYTHTFEELQFGCRLAWRNTGRCIMRKVSFSLELRDCRGVLTAEECFEEIVSHLKYASNCGAIKPVISIFPPKEDGQSGPVRIWNPQLICYAAYKLHDGTIMGDPARLQFTALCVKFGWAPPPTKSSFDILPILISDEEAGHAVPKLFELPNDAVLEVELHHPEHDHFSHLNLRWYAIPAISNMGADIGGIIYQTCPFNGWYQITEISRDLLDAQRYNLAEAVAMACDIPRTTVSVWRDDVQLQMHRAILHSFALQSVSTVDHHTASEQFLDFYKSEIQKRKRCPADWVWIVPPAGGSMTGVFHQEMLNFIVKPQYRVLEPIWNENNIVVPNPVICEDCNNTCCQTQIKFDKDKAKYDRIVVYFGTETSTSLKYATKMITNIDNDCCSGPFALDNLPDIFKRKHKAPASIVKPDDDNILILVFTSTYGKGNPPSNATKFMPKMKNVKLVAGRNYDFAVFSLGNSAYTQSFAKFGHVCFNALKEVGCVPITNMKIADELKNQNESFDLFTQLLLDEKDGLLNNLERDSKIISGDTKEYDSSDDDNNNDQLCLEFVGVTKVNSMKTNNKLLHRLKESFTSEWNQRSNILGRSMDLFAFSLPEGSAESIDRLFPGDHISILPTNLKSTTDFIFRMLDMDDDLHRKDIEDEVHRRIDLAKALSDDEIFSLMKYYAQGGEARTVLELLLLENKPASVEVLASQLPPGSIPARWLLETAPKMEPRFYSIASISKETLTVSILQSLYSQETGKAGTTSAWLRSLQPGEEIKAKFSSSDFHLPDDETCPIMLFATGSGIAPFRSFWASKARNAMVLFYGTKNPKEFPFVSEIKQLRKNGIMDEIFIAYSSAPGKKKTYIQHLMMKQTDIILKHLYHKKSVTYVCGSPGMESAVREKLILILSEGNSLYPGLEVTKAAERLAFYKHTKRYISEVYGIAGLQGEVMEKVW
eukprot:CAMPEP_0197831986 /NCGR_PEP_ID=MMETSP1437-20131217/12885_1 /TAXON_ID=49252 ORGANISM="Eucampia antarctica, Strain CCMP1452" /NCGR_SAMPLE_ID=MMETSP1437 /ASSEMBLY_ACC=CAM_ASM_001096 /LENGTH=1175 /DNA_ID=CAMNT_0043435141 /DNA_START=197 /DNA_END=3721 /DNA_ORIENTATION=-